MAVTGVQCEKCKSIVVIKYGKTLEGKQRYFCKNCSSSFILDYTYQACKAGTEESVIKMSTNASSIQNISRALDISTDTVVKILKRLHQQ